MPGFAFVKRSVHRSWKSPHDFLLLVIQLCPAPQAFGVASRAFGIDIIHRCNSTKLSQQRTKKATRSHRRAALKFDPLTQVVRI
jgi:hypothetical protein